jgi:hypothetical protein
MMPRAARCRSSNSSRAASPCWGWSRIWGSGPSAPTPWKKNDQSIDVAGRVSAGSSTWVTENGGGATSSWRHSDGAAVRERLAVGQERVFSSRRGRAGAGLDPMRFSAPTSPFRPGSSRLETTPTTREASMTCTTGCFVRRRDLTAVCCRRWWRRRSAGAALIPRRCISVATFTISVSDGVMSPDNPTMSALSLDRRVQDQFRPGAITRGRSPGSCCNRARRRRCSYRCRGRRP